jgi:hypothetical protein
MAMRKLAFWSDTVVIVTHCGLEIYHLRKLLYFCAHFNAYCHCGRKIRIKAETRTYETRVYISEVRRQQRAAATTPTVGKLHKFSAEQRTVVKFDEVSGHFTRMILRLPINNHDDTVSWV